MEDFDYIGGDPNFMSGQDFANERREGLGCLIWTIVLIVVVLALVTCSIIF